MKIKCSLCSADIDRHDRCLMMNAPIVVDGDRAMISACDHCADRHGDDVHRMMREKGMKALANIAMTEHPSSAAIITTEVNAFNEAVGVRSSFDDWRAQPLSIIDFQLCGDCDLLTVRYAGAFDPAIAQRAADSFHAGFRHELAGLVFVNLTRQEQHRFDGQMIPIIEGCPVTMTVH